MDALRGQLDEKRLAGAWGSSELGDDDDDGEADEGLEDDEGLTWKGGCVMIDYLQVHIKVRI